MQEASCPISRASFPPYPRSRKAAKFLYVAGILLLLSSCDDRPDQWDAYVTYSEDPERTEVIEGFKSYELCRAASLKRIDAEGATKTGYFECGYKCGLNRQYGMKLCKETRD